MRPYFRIAIAAVALSAGAQAASGFSAFAEAPLPQGSNLLHAQFGWPGISVSLLHGASQKASFGGRFTFNYGQEGLVGGIDLGLKFQGVVRLGLADTGRINLGLELAPGVAIYFPNGGAFTQVGLTIPVALVLGVPISDALTLHAGVDLPMLITFTNYQTFYIPIYLGGGLEYALDKNLQLTLELQMGPMIDARLSRSYFGMEALFGLAFRL